MKKLPALLLMILLPLFLWAQEYDNDFSSVVRGSEDIEDEIEPDMPAKSRPKNRTVELSIANISFDFSNNFIAAADFFRNPFYMLWNVNDIRNDASLVYRDDIIINLDDFLNGFKFNFGAAIRPFSFNFNRNDKWGFGLDIGHIDIMGNVFISGNMMRLRKIKDDRFGVSAAVFADVGIPVFFHADLLKIKIRPAAYVPIVYTEPGITYTGQKGKHFEIKFNQHIYSIVDMDSDIMQGLINDAQDIPKNNLGYDLGLGAEYPWDYDLDIGVDIINIPIPYASAKLYHYAQLRGTAFLDTDLIDLANLTNGEGIPDNALGLPDDLELEYGGYNSEGKRIYRPFAMLFYLKYRPPDSRTTLIPSLGFSVNWLYPQIFSLEGGLSARFDFSNIFITVLGINYNDRKWKNSADFILNFRAFELDLGLSMRSQDFLKSFQGAGLGVNFGIKLGW